MIRTCSKDDRRDRAGVENEKWGGHRDSQINESQAISRRVSERKREGMTWADEEVRERWTVATAGESIENQRIA
jgi:hypothetical protein